MNNVDFDPNKFEQDAYGNLIPKDEPEEHDPEVCGCEHKGNSMWSCDHIDNLRIEQDTKTMDKYGLIEGGETKEDVALGLYP